MLGILGQLAYRDPGLRLLIVGVASFPVQFDELLVATLRGVWRAPTQAVE
jgi:hypothetical protein